MIKSAKQKHNPSQAFANIKPENTETVFHEQRMDRAKTELFHSLLSFS